MTYLTLKKLTVAATLALSAFFSCQSGNTSIAGWDAKAWIDDQDGCQGKRAAQWSAFREKRHQFLGMEEDQLKNMLGYPLNKELMERGQKIYRFSIRNGLRCGGVNKVLALRISAMHTVTEITEE